MKDHVGRADIVMITLDTLRYDVAQEAWKAGKLLGLSPHLGPNGWQKRHTPASFTYAAHHAFLSGFLPTPIVPGPHPRRFASDFAGSETIASDTFVFEESTLPEALSRRSYSTICIGGTGFFNQQNALARVLPGLFQEAHWSPEMGVTEPTSQVHQVKRALGAMEGRERIFLLMNMSALHQPNWFYGPQSSGPDTLESHLSALIAVDQALIPLWTELSRRRPTFVMIFSDHGTAYGEDGYRGHRVGHESVWTVPYAEFTL